jgi:hypothetical protein
LCVIERNNLQKECACDATPVVPREKIEDKPKPAAKHEQNDKAKKEKPPRRREGAAKPSRAAIPAMKR